ncbi:MAG: YbaK/EbsC family protein [Gammaproteobacteria bacterium]|nr:YbaK/EbsC family protein [Gammaproteobacteria bacterium]
MFLSPMQYLDSEGLQYQVLHHPHAESIKETAILAQLPEAAIARVIIVSLVSKTDVLSVSEAIVLVPGDTELDLVALRNELNVRDVHIVSNTQREGLFTGFDLGSEAPFGHLYGMRVFIAKELFNRFDITFKAGNHETLIRMSTVDFCNLTQVQTIENGYSNSNAAEFYSEQTTKPWRWV